MRVLISSIAFCGIFSLLNIFYKKSKHIKIVVNFVYQAIKNTSKEYAYRPQSFSFFVLLFIFVLTNNMLSIFAFSAIFLNPEVVILLVGLSGILGLIFGLYNKKFRAITDLSPPELPIAVRIIIAPLEGLTVLLRGLIPFFKLYIYTIVSHKIIESLMHICETSSSGVLTFATMNILIFIKTMEIFSAIIQSYIFVVLCTILFGKFNKVEK